MNFTYKKLHHILKDNHKYDFFKIILFLVIATILEFLTSALLVPLTTSLMGTGFSEKNGILYIILNKLFGFLIHDWNNVKSVIIIFISFNCIKAFFSIFNVYYQANYSQKITTYLSETLFRSYLYKDFNFHLKNNSAVLLRNVQIEINQVNYLISNLIQLISEISITIGIFVSLILLNPSAIISLFIFFTFLSIIFYRIIKNKLVNWGLDRQKNDENINLFLIQGFGGIKEIIQLDRSDFFINGYIKNVKEKGKLYVKTLFLQQVPRYFLELLFMIGIFFLFFYLLLNNKNTIELIPILGMLIFSAFRFLPSINKIISSIVAIRYSSPSLNIIYSEINSISISKYYKSLNKIKFTIKVELENIKFSYDNLNPTLDVKYLGIKKGEIVGFYGESGSGKSTLINILMGILTPQTGDIKVDDSSILNNLGSWHRNIGYVPQSIFLLDDTIKNNIAFGIDEENIDINKIITSLELAQLENYNQIFKDGFNTIVGERGASISGGQLQRIGIARALYNDPEILIFDESTSALDNNAEKEIVNTIKNLSKTKTIIIISHNKFPLTICDIVYEIKDGKINYTDSDNINI